MPREVIGIHIGQCGVQLGEECWKLFAKEHHLLPDGTLDPTATNNHDNDGISAFFSETPEQYVPLAVFADLEQTVVEEVCSGSHRCLFNRTAMLTGVEDAANNYMRVYTAGRNTLEQTLDQIRLTADKCSNLQGFMVTHSIGGGTGSGLGSVLLERLSADYRTKSTFAFTVFPSPRIATEVVAPYNTILSIHELLDHTDVNVVLDNESLYNIATHKLEIEQPSYTDLNKMIAQTMSSLTASLRFRGDLNASMNEIQTNLVPFPRLHFVIQSFAPFESQRKSQHEQHTTAQITQSTFEGSSLMVQCRRDKSAYFACCLLYRGDVTVKDVNAAVATAKSHPTIRFVPWNPTGFKQGVSAQPQVPFNTSDGSIKRSVLNVSNNGAVKSVFQTIVDKFDKMYSKRAFVHWYVGEGFSEGFFAEARDDLAFLINNYDQLEN